MNLNIDNYVSLLLDDLNWNHKNSKLGLIEDQNALTLNLDLSQFYAKRKDSNDSLSESYLTINEATLSVEKNGLVNIFTSNKLPSNQNLLALQNSLHKNYWEFEERN